MPRVQTYGNPVATSTAAQNADLEITNWRHRISATVGFDTASFKYQDEKFVLEDLFANALGRRVARYSPDGHFLIWEGFINDMIFSQPGVQNRISLDNMYNRLSDRYTPIDTTANPPTESAETSTAVVNDTTSQSAYGIKEITFTQNHMSRQTAANALQKANTLLAQYKQPRRSKDIRTGGNEFGLEFNCRGYMHTLNWRKYNQTTTSGTQDADDQIGAIITAVGQFIALTSLTNNSTAVQQYFNRDETAFNLIREIASLGDSTNARWLAFVMEGRRLYYEAASTTVKYKQRLGDNRQEFFDLSDRNIPYWELRPNAWVRTIDAYPHNLNPANLINDPQASFIESVEWDEEQDTISIPGAPGDSAQVLVARMAAQGDMLL